MERIERFGIVTAITGLALLSAAFVVSFQTSRQTLHEPVVLVLAER